MHRFWVAATQISKGRVRFTREQAHQIARVLRLHSGDTVAVFDGTGTEHEVELISARVSETTGLLRGRRATMPEPVSRLVLLQGLPKREKMELIVQKATELGIHRVVPVLCERSVTRGSGRLVRWRLIAQEASEQCGRAVVPRVDEPIPLLAFFATEGRGGLRGITLWEGERTRGLKEALRIMAGADTWHLLVGPEGGLAPDEARLAEDRGLVAASLGRRTLRTETATIAALAIIQHELGDLGVDEGK